MPEPSNIICVAYSHYQSVKCYKAIERTDIDKKRCESMTGHFILVLDNASIHKSPASLAALSLFEHRVTVIWLPAYCSDLNPIERFWHYLKEQVCINALYPDMRELLQAVIGQLGRQNDCHFQDRFNLFKFHAVIYLVY